MTPRKIYPSIDQVCRDDTFFLTFSTACNDGLYKVKSESTFRRDMAKLQEVGLIRCISNGKIEELNLSIKCLLNGKRTN